MAYGLGIFKIPVHFVGDLMIGAFEYYERTVKDLMPSYLTLHIEKIIMVSSGLYRKSFLRKNNR